MIWPRLTVARSTGGSWARERSSSSGPPRAAPVASRSRAQIAPNECSSVFEKSGRCNSKSHFQLQAYVRRRIGAIIFAGAMKSEVPLDRIAAGEIQTAIFPELVGQAYTRAIVGEVDLRTVELCRPNPVIAIDPV